jgi:hypothetical protein
MRKVRFPIRKRTFEPIAAAQNDLFVGYVGLRAAVWTGVARDTRPKSVIRTFGGYSTVSDFRRGP